MVRQFIISISLNLVICYGAFAQKHRIDTNFIYRENRTAYQAIFIDKKNSSFYNEVLFNKGNPWDTSLYIQKINSLKSSGISLKKHDLKGLFRDWRPLYLYKKDYYVYAPSEWGMNSWAYISDSTYVEWIFEDGTHPSAINSVQKSKKNLFIVSIINDAGKRSLIKIHLIDRARGIAVFENTSFKGDDRFSLMVAAKKLKMFPIIVNYCNEQKVKELDFDKPEFKKLLKYE